MTLRIRSPVPREYGPKEASCLVVQHTSLSCLVCQTTVYRVAHEVMLAAAPKDGPVWPTNEWTESETLKSKSGWIEVYLGSNGCMVSKFVYIPYALGILQRCLEMATLSLLLYLSAFSALHVSSCNFSLEKFGAHAFYPSTRVLTFMIHSLTGRRRRYCCVLESFILHHLFHTPS